ncbi:DUF6079 family protein [Aequorivita lipolytica]|uniref:DUF6079 domain-containing protein n=1 Tax=Aequorivita lipolytica TaxID=153267 RepID=A0A5C6YU53_9FLAO|nr:DUF6079 family protein [Aequorivita lipolytica]TXD70584.1 hypothetical protein ESV24_00385 [Aequorivita lipolytica]SRX49616.1 hypothetical protein AEQU2_00079 [Aequorivita lipolytica]
MNQETLLQLFLIEFEHEHQKDFVLNEESLLRVNTLINYFTKNKDFFTSPIVSKLSQPSLNKGLLIIGDFGTGKSTILKTLLQVLKKTNVLYSIHHHVMEVNQKYEAAEKPADKAKFMKDFSEANRFFDDILTEEKANNYGVKFIFKDILELRYEKKNLTLMTCNFDPDSPDDVKMGIKQFYEKYGGRVYDRLFEMFNIVEFKGKSYRR